MEAKVILQVLNIVKHSSLENGSIWPPMVVKLMRQRIQMKNLRIQEKNLFFRDQNAFQDYWFGL